VAWRGLLFYASFVQGDFWRVAGGGDLPVSLFDFPRSIPVLLEWWSLPNSYDQRGSLQRLWCDSFFCFFAPRDLEFDRLFRGGCWCVFFASGWANIVSRYLSTLGTQS